MRNLVFFFLRLTSIPLILSKLVQKNKVTILCYHDPAPSFFEQHIRALKKRYNIISLKEYADSRTEGSTRRLPPKSLVITIDDGFAANYHLQGVVASHGVPVTIFLCSGIVSTNRHYWWTVIQSPEDTVLMEKISDDERLRELAKQGFQELREYDTRQSLSSKEISELKETFDFQAHTQLHPILPRCSMSRARREITESKTELETMYGLSIYALAYPHGKYGEREAEIAKEAGYRCAVTTDSGVNNSITDLFKLKRICINDSAGVSEVIVKASGFWDVLRNVVPRRREHTRLVDSAGSV
jgi:peptidoglycan/xylan/chitin deacetylase (PgdA/CDA1 family)